MDLARQITELKAARNAVILAHNYTVGDVQDSADFVGDSLELAQKAAATAADVIVFCGVHFMAETAAILNPGKTVLMPDQFAGCPMANMITPKELAARTAELPGVKVVTYVNSTAAIKAMSDICCTSANAVKVVQSMGDAEILFVPDQYLGHYVQTRLGKALHLWPGFCPTHRRIRPRDIKEARAAHPEAKVVVHPECMPETIALADHVGSTSGILRFCRESDAREFIIGTELGLLHRLTKENPDKRFYLATELSDCPNMKLTTLEKVFWCLRDLEFVITVPPDIAQQARVPIERMLEVV
ncbi:MAG: quinolinate synthase NadA [Candidatus Eisenbacteria bacterium]|jgi:quinolinate synthase|nr:quinolinate synthase NadA [Candidatus Eisenbacteria bacterium]